jgi:IS30 family transposase
MLKSSTNQEKCYTHLSLAEREEIAIALEQGRSPSSVSREIKRNSPPLNKVEYRGNRAQRRAEDCSRHGPQRNVWPIPWSKSMWNTI